MLPSCSLSLANSQVAALNDKSPDRQNPIQCFVPFPLSLHRTNEHRTTIPLAGRRFRRANSINYLFLYRFIGPEKTSQPVATNRSTIFPATHFTTPHQTTICEFVPGKAHPQIHRNRVCINFGLVPLDVTCPIFHQQLLLTSPRPVFPSRRQLLCTSTTKFYLRFELISQPPSHTLGKSLSRSLYQQQKQWELTNQGMNWAKHCGICWHQLVTTWEITVRQLEFNFDHLFFK